MTSIMTIGLVTNDGIDRYLKNANDLLRKVKLSKARRRTSYNGV